MKNIKRKMRLFGAFFMVIGLLLGALGSHYFKSILSATALESFEVGLKYLIYQGLGLLLLSGLEFRTQKQKKLLYYLLVGGTLVFSGSIFILSFKSLLPFSVSFLGPLTPIGGTVLIIAWGYAFSVFYTTKN